MLPGLLWESSSRGVDDCNKFITHYSCQCWCQFRVAFNVHVKMRVAEVVGVVVVAVLVVVTVVVVTKVYVAVVAVGIIIVVVLVVWKITTASVHRVKYSIARMITIHAYLVSITDKLCSLIPRRH
jgi:hypothetical protein